MNEEIAMTKGQRMTFMFTLLMGSFTMSISQSSLSTAYPTLMRYFDVSAPTIQWLTTGFMLMMCIMMPVSPWLMNNVNFKALYLGVMILFELGTLLIVFAHNFWWALGGRLLEGMAVGIRFTTFQAVLLLISPRKNRAKTMGFVGLVLGSALACGPIISGIVLNYMRWQNLFWLFMIIIAILIIMSLFSMRDVVERHEYQLDFVAVLYSVGLVGLLYFINSWGSSRTLSLWLGGEFVISAILTALFVQRNLTAPKPMLDLKVLRYGNFDIGMLLTGLAYISLIVTTVLYPMFYQDVLGYSPLVSGLALVPPAILLSILNPLTGRLTGKLGMKRTLLIGMVMILAGWAGLEIFMQQLHLLSMILLACLIEGGNAFVMMPATTLGANSLPEHLIPHGTAVTTTMRQILGSLGVALAMLLVTYAGHTTMERAGYGYAFGFFFALELVGLILALMIKEQRTA